MRLLQLVAFVNELNFKNATTFFTSASVRETALNKAPLFCLSVLVQELGTSECLLQVLSESGDHVGEEYRGEICKKSAFKREGRADQKPTRRASFSWFQLRSRTIGAHHGAERI